MDERADGFFGRWARRKTQVLEGKPLDEPLPVSTPPLAPLPVAGVAVTQPDEAGKLQLMENDASLQGEAPAQPAPALTLDDVRLLTKDSDFKPFMARGVGPGVRNAAMKKLFADPHFNVMDRLDIYIDDYSKPDPIPAAMMRQLASAKFLKLFDDEEQAESPANSDHTIAAAPRESANNPTDESVAQSVSDSGEPQPAPLPAAPADPTGQAESPAPPGPRQEDHADLDLRLQPDHAAPAPGAGRGSQ